MESLSERQREVFQALETFIYEQGYPPTMRDLAKKLGIVNPTAVKRMLDIFRERGLVESNPRKSRAIKLKHPLKFFPEEILSLPVAGRIVAGLPSEAIESHDEQIHVPSFLANHNPKAFILTIKGESMEPELHEGDLVVIHPQPVANPKDLVAALIDGEATVKQFLIKNQKYFLHPLNPSYPDIRLNQDFKLIGKITGMLRKF